MSTPSCLFRAILASSVALSGVSTCLSDEKPASADKEPAKKEGKEVDDVKATADASSKSAKSGDAAEKEKPKYPPHTTVLKDAKPVSGMIKLYYTDTKLFAELTSNDLNKDFIVLISIAKGIGQTPLLGGFSWGIGDDWLWQFRKVGERIHLVRRNVRFTAAKDSPEANAVKLAYTDSVLFSLPIATKGPGGGYVVDLTPVFMSDLPQISQVLRGFSFSSTKSTFEPPKGFENNVELQVAATYASSGSQEIETVADSRGATINVHYSISKLPQTGYKPREADDRVGYFLTVIKDYSKKGEQDRFVRYINRWDLQKADPKAKLSPPKKPIVFWLEKSIPFKYRKPIRDGIEEWNKAFEKAGFVNAIEARQQPDNATWDPGDVNYNTFRWITAGAGFSMGPSRVNPLTGQILDADIIFDADFLQFWKQEYETFTPKGIELMTGGPVDLQRYRESQADPVWGQSQSHHRNCACTLLSGMSRQLALGATVMATRTQKPEELEELIVQALKDVTMHEVGHTLGLRHNFKASTFYSLEDANNPRKTRKTGIAASVMDYTPANIVPKNEKQGDFYSATLGPYDEWAIEFGYKPVSGDEAKELKKIASRSGEPGLAYSTDEDTRGIDPDPLSNRFDLGEDTLAYAKQQATLVAETWPDIVNRLTEEGEGYQQARRAFGVLLGTHGRSMFFAARYIGGLHVSRSHKGDKDAKPPFEVVDADKQREALELLENEVFSDKPFQFPPELYNHLAASNWKHWGMDYVTRADYPIHRAILMWQERILDQLLSSLTLSRLYDSELKVPSDQDAFTTAELIERLTKAIFSEVDGLEAGDYTNRKPAISSLRRNLQREYLQRLSDLALGKTSAPQDCQTIAYAELETLEGRVKKTVESDIKLDSYSRAHLKETASRIRKVLDAEITQPSSGGGGGIRILFH